VASKLYGEYKDFCMRDGRKYKSGVAFTKELKAYGKRTGKFIYVERTNGHSTGFFKGVDIASKWDDDNFEDTSPRVDMNRATPYPDGLNLDF